MALGQNALRKWGYKRKDNMAKKNAELKPGEPSYEELKNRVATLEKQNEDRELSFRVGEKGGVSVYGLGRFPVTLYYEQWQRLLDASIELQRFLAENKTKLKLKEVA